MRDYGKVHTCFWSSSTIRSMSEDARTMALYMMTCSHGTIAGVFRLPDGYVCEDLQWSNERVNATLSELLGKGFANRCETTKWVWIIKHLEWNPPENPNQKKSAAKLANQIPDECCWKQDYIRDCGEIIGVEVDEKSEPFRNPSETLSQPVAVTVTVSKPIAPSSDDAVPRKPKFDFKGALIESGVDPGMASDYIAVRRAKKCAQTKTAFDLLAKEVERAGCGFSDAVELCCKRGWGGFDAKWVKPGDFADKPDVDGVRSGPSREFMARMLGVAA